MMSRMVPNTSCSPFCRIELNSNPTGDASDFTTRPIHDQFDARNAGFIGGLRLNQNIVAFAIFTAARRRLDDGNRLARARRQQTRDRIESHASTTSADNQIQVPTTRSKRRRINEIIQ
jgi:hypothetical protein